MSALPTSPDPAAPLPRSHFNNWISAIGGVIAVGALFSFALLVWMDFTQHNANPYLGIFTYLVAPGFLIGGLVLVFFGAWAQRRGRSSTRRCRTGGGSISRTGSSGAGLCSSAPARSCS
jgi:hypothetical protein